MRKIETKDQMFLENMDGKFYSYRIYPFYEFKLNDYVYMGPMKTQ